MALDPGNVVIGNDGSVTKSGYAGDRFQEYYDDLAAKYQSWGQPFPPSDPAVKKQELDGLADRANDGKKLLQYLIDNGYT